MTNSLLSYPEVTIIVVSFNTRELTLECLASIYEQDRMQYDFELVIVDNASSDGSLEAIASRYPQARLIPSDENIGFAQANNLAVRSTEGRFILLLNPDTVILDHGIDKLIDFAQNDGGNGIYGGRTLFADGSLNPQSCWRDPTLWSMFCVAAGLTRLAPWSDLFNPDCMPRWQRDSIRHVDIISGCFLLISRKNWECLGGFDPAFHMYGEEFDFCMRAKKRGIQCKVTPDAEIIHYGGASERVRADKMCRLFETKVMLFRKHWHPLRAWVGCQLLKVWVLSRIISIWGLDVLRGRKDRVKVWLTMWRRRSIWLSGRSS